MQKLPYSILARVVFIFFCAVSATGYAKQPDIQVRVEALPDSMVSNQFYVWNLVVQDAQGGKPAGLKFKVKGRMPEHAHGLPSEPKVVEEKPGVYQIRGLMFNMPGRWVVDIWLDEKMVLRQEFMIKI